MSSSKKARVELRSLIGGVEFSLVNSNLEQVTSGVGSLDARVDPGIYQLEVRAGPRVESDLLVLEPGDVHRDLEVKLDFPSAVPLEGTTTSHEFQQDAVVRESARLAERAGPNSGLVVIVRNARGHEHAPFDAETVRKL